MVELQTLSHPFLNLPNHRPSHLISTLHITYTEIRGDFSEVSEEVPQDPKKGHSSLTDERREGHTVSLVDDGEFSGGRGISNRNST